MIAPKYRNISVFLCACFESLGLHSYRKGTQMYLGKGQDLAKQNLFKTGDCHSLARDFASLSVNFDSFFHAFVSVLSIIFPGLYSFT